MIVIYITEETFFSDSDNISMWCGTRTKWHF